MRLARFFALQGIIVWMVLGFAHPTFAQSAPPNDPYPPVYPAPPPAYPAPAPPPPTVPPYPPYPPYSPSLQLQAPVPVGLIAQWRGARAMNIFSGIIGLASTGLSVTSAIYLGAAHYPPSASDLAHVPKASDPGEILSLVSSGSAAFSFGLGAGGLAWRHHILQRLNADPGRGLFIGGTVVGAIGLAAIVTSYIIGFGNIGNPHDRSISVLTTSLGGSAVCNIGSALYAADSSNLTKAWNSLMTF